MTRADAAISSSVQPDSVERAPTKMMTDSARRRDLEFSKDIFIFPISFVGAIVCAQLLKGNSERDAKRFGAEVALGDLSPTTFDRHKHNVVIKGNGARESFIIRHNFRNDSVDIIRFADGFLERF